MTKFIRWLTQLCAWLVEPRAAWVCVTVVILAFALTRTIPKPVEDTLRYAGLVLQLLGIATVVRGLRERGELFQRPTIFTSFQNWLNRIPRLNPKPIYLSANMSTQANACSATGVVTWNGPQADATLEARVNALSENLETLRRELGEQAARTIRDTVSVRVSIENEVLLRTKELVEIRSKLSSLGAGGLHVELVGVAWLFFGTVLATVPSEIVVIFSRAT